MGHDVMDALVEKGQGRKGNVAVEKAAFRIQDATAELVAHARHGEHLRDELGSIATQAESSDDSALALRVMRLFAEIDPERGRPVLQRYVESADGRGALSRSQLEDLAHVAEIAEEAFIRAAGRELAYDSMVDQHTEDWTVGAALRCIDEQDRSLLLAKIVQDAQAEIGVGSSSMFGGPVALPYLVPALDVLAPLVYPVEADRWRWFIGVFCGSDSSYLDQDYREPVTDVLNGWSLPETVAQEVAEAAWQSMVDEDFFVHFDALVARIDDEEE